MISILDARRVISSAVSALGTEQVALSDALGRVLSADVLSTIDLPAFRQSSMDGYAVYAADTASATLATPVRLRVTGKSTAGMSADSSAFGRQETYRIFTGAVVPTGADAIAIQENVTRDGDFIVVTKPVAPGEFIRNRGDELRGGTVVAHATTRVNAGHISTLSAAGITQVLVRKTPRVTVLVTGDEVVSPTDARHEGQVFDANTPILAGYFLSRGITPTIRYLRDSAQATESAIRDALEHSDLIVTTGGVSVGDHDYVRPAVHSLSMNVHFERVAQKPGKPMVFATLGNKVFLGLAGNTGAVFCCLAMYAPIILAKLLDEEEPRQLHGILAKPARADAQREMLLRCSVSVDAAARLMLWPLEGQHSHFVGGLGGCHAIAVLPSKQGDFAEGAMLEWHPTFILGDW